MTGEHEMNQQNPSEKRIPGFTLVIANDHLSADIIVHTPQENTLSVTTFEIDEALNKNHITYGIDQSAIDLILGNPPYEEPIRIAVGQAAVDGVPASIEYKIKTEIDAHPHEREDGTVDYKDLGIIQNVRKGDLLAVKIPAEPGSPGTNIHGAVLPPKPGRDVPLPIGKNTFVSDDSLMLYASIDGQADVVNRKIHILNTYTVNGDVAHATGNINFLGNVIVAGNVHTGFSIQATGNIAVEGSVEGAELSAEGNIIVKEGINGFGKGSIKAGGYIKCKYIQSATVQAVGDVETNFILHSNVQSGAVVRSIGAKATIAGGRVTALKRIEAVFVGGRGTLVNTILEVGNDPVTLARYREVPLQIAKCEKDIASFDRAISLFQEYQQKNRLTEEKLAALQKAIETKKILSEYLKGLEEEFNQVKESLSSFGYGVISIKEAAYSGVRIFIGSERMNLESKHTACSFVRDQSGIRIGPYR